MKLLRPLSFLLLGLGLLVGAAGWIISRPTLQTWLVLRAFSGRVGYKVEIGRVVAGWDHLELEGLRVEHHGRVLNVPSAHLELSIFDALRGQLILKGLVARGWTLDLTGRPEGREKTVERRRETTQRSRLFFAALGAPSPGVPSAGSVLPLVSEPAGFEGILRALELPFDLSLAAAQLEGQILFPGFWGPRAGVARVAVEGGPLSTGTEGAFAFHSDFHLEQEGKLPLEFSAAGKVFAEMETLRNFRRLRIETALTGADGASDALSTKKARFIASKEGSEEVYELAVFSNSSAQPREILNSSAHYDHNSGTLTGKWSCNARETDFSAFLPGRGGLAEIAIVGEGSLSLDRTLAEVHVVGKADTSFKGLEAIRPELSLIGPLHVRADFDIFQHAGSVRVEKLGAELFSAHPVATVTALQAFEFDRKTGELKVADPATDLLHLTMQQVPTAWTQLLAKDFTVQGDDLRGEFVVGARRSGFELRPLAPMVINHFELSQRGVKRLQGVDLSMLASGVYSPAGWQVDVSELKLQQDRSTLFVATCKIGQPVGAAQPIKVRGDYRVECVTLAQQPLGSMLRGLTAGHGTGVFFANISAETRAVEANVDFSELRTAGQTLPDSSAQIRADFHADGTIDAHVPVTITSNGRKSDLELAIHAVTEDRGLEVEAQLTSKLLFLEDAKTWFGAFAAVPLPRNSPPRKSTFLLSDGRENPFWTGWLGQLKVALDEVVCSPALRATRVSGAVKMEPQVLTIENVHGELGEGSDGKLSGSVTFSPGAKAPYEFASLLNLSAFDFGSLTPPANKGTLPLVEGRFDLAGKVHGRADSLLNWEEEARAELKLNCRGGKFHAFDTAAETSLGKIQQGLSSRIANLLAMGASMIGHSSAASSAERGRAASSALRHFSNIEFDQLNLELSVQPKVPTTITSFSMISPEMRMNGEGEIARDPSRPFMQLPLKLELQVGLQGSHADDLRLLGLLRTEPDELGYSLFSEKLLVQGTPSEINGSALLQLIQQKLAAP